MLWETSVTVKHLIKKASLSGAAKFYKTDGKILEAEQKKYASFRRVHELSYMTVPEMLETVHENDLFDMFPVFSNEIHILGVIPFTIIQCVAQIENLPPQHHGKQCISNIALFY